MSNAQAMLADLLARHDISVAGRPVAVMDIGAQSTELVLLVKGRVALVDVAGWGGNALVGGQRRTRRETGFSNPLVEAVARWAGDELRHSDREVLRVLAQEGEDAAAFSYLAGIRWRGGDFVESSRMEHERAALEAVVLYWLAALFHNLGLRYCATAGETSEPLLHVVLAGNGGRFARWLIPHWSRGDNPFRDTLYDVLAAAAGSAAPEGLEVLLSSHPKQEVAHGVVLAHSRPPTDLPRADVVVGESIRVQTESGEVMTHQPLTSLPPRLHADERVVERIHWDEGCTQIEAFHRVLVKAARHRLVAVGGRWGIVIDELEKVCAAMPRRELEAATRVRLEYLVRQDGTIPANLFFVEAGAVLDILLHRLFGSSAWK